MTTETAPTKKPELWKVNDQDLLETFFHPGQQAVMDSEARFVAMMSGSQSGKTSFAPLWLNQEITKAFDAASETELRTEGVGDFLAVTSTYDLFNLKMRPELLKLFVDTLKIGHYWAGDRVIELTENLEPNGKLWAEKSSDKMFGRIILRSAESDSGLESTTAKAAWLDEVGQEQFTLTSWQAILARLSLNEGRILGTTSLYQLGWLKTEWYDRWEAGDPDYDVIQFDSTMNPQFPKKEFERLRRTTATWHFSMRYQGRYARPAGLVYDRFDEATQILDDFAIPNDWLWYCGHDFGLANPAQLAVAHDPRTGHFYVVKAWKPGNKAVYEQVETLKDWFQGKRVLRRVGGSHGEKDSRENYTAQGWPIVEPMVPSVERGIRAVYAQHALNNIFVFKSCVEYVDEKTRYSYKLDATGDKTDEIRNKSSFHVMDCERAIFCGFTPDRGQKRGPNHVRRGRW